jgi:hypothetical protein
MKRWAKDHRELVAKYAEGRAQKIEKIEPQVYDTPLGLRPCLREYYSRVFQQYPQAKPLVLSAGQVESNRRRQ